MGFRRDGAIAHGAGGEALYDIPFAFDLFQGHGRSGHAGLKLQQASEGGLSGRHFVGVLRETPVSVFALVAHSHLEIGYGDGIPHVPIAAPAPVKLAGIVQHWEALALPLRVGKAVATAHLFGEDGEIGPLNTARGAAEALIDHAGGEAHGFKDLGALIGLKGGDAHLGHDLQNALGRALAIGGHHVVVALDMRCVIQQAVPACLPEGFKG